MEACGGAHHWVREISKLGHEVRLIPASYVKSFVKRQKNDMADAETICGAAQRPTMRFVAVKSEEQQASAVVFRARDLLVRQRTQLINALRGHLAEYGIVVAQGPSHVAKLISNVEDPTSRLTDGALEALLIAGGGAPAGQRHKAEPDWTEVHRELRRPSVTLMLLWDEYRATTPGGYQYSRWCELYRAWEARLSPTMRLLQPRNTVREDGARPLPAREP